MPRQIPAECLGDLATSPQGLDAQVVIARRGRYGANDILEVASGGWRVIAKDSLRDPMLWFLLVTSLLFGVTGDRIEALVLLAALVPLFTMDAWLHRRTQASIAGLSGALATAARVRRAGVAADIPARDLVPGDLVELQPGDSVPADGVLLRASDAQVDESALTGESYPVRKAPIPAPARLAVSVDDEHWLLAGTRLLSGTAELLIVQTGAATLYGEIVRSAVRGGHAQTPLQRAVAQLVRVLVYAALVVCVVLAWVRFHQGHGLVDALLSAVTLAVAALPEEFPVVLTFYLGVGIYRLAQRRALVRRAVVVENIGRVTCICTDKTGTLTEGRLRLSHCRAADDSSDARLLELAGIAARRETGDPMDVAILEAVPEPIARAVATFPFTEDRKRETGIVEAEGALLAAVKGAPEVVLAMSELDPVGRQFWTTLTDEFAASGHKVIAVASRTLGGPWSGGEPDRGFQFAGLLAFEDPVREGVAEALGECRAAGIRVIMVTGDHPATAAAVARELGLAATEPNVIDGAAMESRLLQLESGALRDVDVIARAVPAQKLRLVRALQAQGEIVAVTGDGVNDVPALHAADVGIAMGGRGTRSAREVAAIVLLDDNFRSIVRAIAEGRQLFRNLQRSFQYLLMIHIPLVITAAAIPLGGYPLLYLPIHIVWLELVIHPTALLVFQALPADLEMPAVRRRPDVRFFDRAQWFVIVLTGLAITLVVTMSFVRSLGSGHDLEHARAMALAALTLASAGITAMLSRLHGALAWMLVVATVLLSIVLIETPWLAARLHLRPLHLDDWLIAIAGALLVALIPLVGSSWQSARRRSGRAAQGS